MAVKIDIRAVRCNEMEVGGKIAGDRAHIVQGRFRKPKFAALDGPGRILIGQLGTEPPGEQLVHLRQILILIEFNRGSISHPAIHLPEVVQARVHGEVAHGTIGVVLACKSRKRVRVPHGGNQDTTDQDERQNEWNDKTAVTRPCPNLHKRGTGGMGCITIHRPSSLSFYRPSMTNFLRMGRSATILSLLFRVQFHVHGDGVLAGHDHRAFSDTQCFVPDF